MVRPDTLAARPAAEPTGSTGPWELRGRVLDSQGEGLPGATVLVLGTTLGTSSGADGEFRLVLPAGEQAVTLHVGFVGYQSTEQPLTRATATFPLCLELADEVTGNFGYTLRPPAPWHPRALYSWGRYWLTRPFRR